MNHYFVVLTYFYFTYLPPSITLKDPSTACAEKEMTWGNAVVKHREVGRFSNKKPAFRRATSQGPVLPVMRRVFCVCHRQNEGKYTDIREAVNISGKRPF